MLSRCWAAISRRRRQSLGGPSEPKPTVVLVRRGARQSRVRGKVQCADAVEQQLLRDARKHENPTFAYRRLAARFQIRAWSVRNGISEDALVLGDGNQEPRTHRRVGRRLFDPPLGDAQSCRVLHVPSAGMDCRAYA